MKRTWSWIALLGGISLIIWMTIALICALAPFGMNSIAFEGSNPGFLSLLPDFRLFFTGSLSPFSLLNYPLAGNAVALFAFYLFSPFNIFFILVGQGLFPLLLNWGTGLKMILAGLSFYFMLFRLFPSIKESFSNKAFGLVLSLAYGMGPAALMQSENAYWLDGLILTPLIICSICTLVQKGRISLGLILCSALMICVNWYQAFGIGLFGLVFLILRMISLDLDDRLDYSFLKIFTSYLLSILLALMCSAVLFFPVISSLWQGLVQNIGFELSTPFLETLREGFSSQNLILFWLPAGAVGLMGAFLSLLGKGFSWKERLFNLIFLLWGCSWLILPAIPSLKMPGISTDAQNAFGFLCSFSILFLSAQALFKQETSSWPSLIASLICSLAVLGFLCGIYLVDTLSQNQILLFSIEAALSLFLFLSLIGNWKSWKGWSVLLIASISVELLWSGHTLLNLDENSTALAQYQSRSEQIARLSGQIKNKQVLLLGSTQEEPQFKALAVNNRSLLFQSNGLYFLSHLGLINSRNSSDQLQADSLPVLSLLGAELILSDHPLFGYDLIDQDGNYLLYQNPYVLPEAMLYQPDSDLVFTTDPFENQNRLYSFLSGTSVSMYQEIESTLEGNNVSELSYELKLPKGNYLYYGYMPDQQESAILYVNGEYAGTQNGAQIFSIPESDGTVSVTLRANRLQNGLEARFAALDLDIFSAAIKTLKENSVDSIRSGSYLSVQNIHAKPGESLFTRLLNSSTLEMELSSLSPVSLIDGALVSVDGIGSNESVLFYYFLPSLAFGQWTTIAGLVITAFLAFYYWRSDRRSKAVVLKDSEEPKPVQEAKEPETRTLPPNLPPLPQSVLSTPVTPGPESEFFEDYQNEQSPLFDITFDELED